MNFITNAIERARQKLTKKVSPSPREDKLTEIIEFSEAVSDVLERPYFIKLVSQVEGEMVEHFINTPVEDYRVRDQIAAAINIHRRYLAFMLQAAKRGQWAQSELEAIWRDRDQYGTTT